MSNYGHSRPSPDDPFEPRCEKCRERIEGEIHEEYSPGFPSEYYHPECWLSREEDDDE